MCSSSAFFLTWSVVPVTQDVGILDDGEDDTGQRTSDTMIESVKWRGHRCKGDALQAIPGRIPAPMMIDEARRRSDWVEKIAPKNLTSSIQSIANRVAQLESDCASSPTKAWSRHCEAETCAIAGSTAQSYVCFTLSGKLLQAAETC